MKTSLNRRTSTVFAAFRPNACAWNPTRLNGRPRHGTNEWLMAQRGAA
ncbi:hypothetical protein [Paraburkholderia sp. BL21I4N1]|nr:hypothetical protein [Paraburkholderia sp. BL21I4N1]